MGRHAGGVDGTAAEGGATDRRAWRGDWMGTKWVGSGGHLSFDGCFNVIRCQLYDSDVTCVCVCSF